MKAAVISLDQVWEDKEANYKRCVELIDTARSFHCDIIIFPELTLTGFSIDAIHLAEDPRQSSTLDSFRYIAKTRKLAIAFGMSTSCSTSDKMRNRLYIVDKQGEVVSDYTKLHPFSYANENQFYESGDNLAFASIEGASFGSSICYDLRFPELFSIYANNVDIMLNIANWPESRVIQWDTLLKARAIENQFYMVGVNRQGKDGKGLNYSHSSKIYKPDGSLLEPIECQRELDIYEIDLSKVQSVRDVFPVLRDRRTSLYSELSNKKS